MTYDTVRDALTHIPDMWPRNRATGVVQYTMASPLEGDVSQFHISFVAGVATVTEGPAEDPEADIQMSADDFISMCNGTLNVMQGWMKGSFVVTGRNVTFVRNMRMTR